jgi:hypothetical protein
MKKILALAFLAPVAVSLAQESPPPMSYQRTFGTAYLNQNNKAYGPAGRNYCGPTSAAMAVSWLAKHGFPQLLPPGSDPIDRLHQSVKLLASPDFMDTDPDDGTSPSKFIGGFSKYVQQAGYKVSDIGYAGWRIPNAGTPGRLVSKVPDFNLLRTGLNQPNSAVFLNVGYYTRTPAGTYRRGPGHWLTVVGYGTSGKGDTDPSILLLHNPAHNYKIEVIKSKDLAIRLEPDVARLTPIEGMIQNSKGKLIQSLSGMVSIEGPVLTHGPKFDVVIVDAVLTITLEAQ